jgi:hypothetical protein
MMYVYIEIHYEYTKIYLEYGQIRYVFLINNLCYIE